MNINSMAVLEVNAGCTRVGLREAPQSDGTVGKDQSKLLRGGNISSGF